jgi:hypothetical protein
MGNAKGEPIVWSDVAAVVRSALVFGIRRRAAIAVVLVLAASLYGGLKVWNWLEGDVLTRPEHSLEPHQIRITPVPPWIRADVKAEALRDSSLDEKLSMLDEQLVERLARAFAMHPWVARVERIAKQYPGRVSIELVYRRPTAMVEVPGGLFPVDEAGVLLPSGDFSTADVGNYPRVAGIETQPLGPAGSSWGDRNVADGAKIAAALREYWHAWRLHSIRPAAAFHDQRRVGQSQFEIVTQAGTVIPWGHAPGSETTGELPLAEKLSRLKESLVHPLDLDDSAQHSSRNVPERAQE